MGGRGHLRHALGLSQALASSALLTGVFLLSYLALMFLILKFVDRVSGANLGNIEVSHLLSAHIVLVLRFLIRLLDTANFAFV